MDTKKIGIYIALNRKTKGLTQEQLGEKLGVSNKTVSRWENGNYMPDLSLLEPLSDELGITLNELLAGEKIEKQDIGEYTEKNLISTIGYTSKKINTEHKKISFLVMSIGIILVLYAFILCNAESDSVSFISVIGIVLFNIGIFRELKLKTFKKILVSIIIFVFIFTGLQMIDYIVVTSYKRPPIYRYMTKTLHKETNITVYYALFFNVYQINADSYNEYYIVDNKKEYTLETVPVSPFNRKISGIDNLEKYKNDYIGDNSNTGMLISILPLSEYGYVFEIDSRNSGLIIDYHSTDWYANDNSYIEKSLLYNSVSTFALINNVEYIKYNFSGSSYKVTRNDILKNFPNYERLFTGKQISKDNFNRYVEKKMNDTAFIKSVFTLFDS